MGFFSAAAASKRPPLALWGICAAAVLAVGIAAAYRNGLPGPFLYDDISSIPGNPTLRSWSAAAHPPAEATVGGRPLLNLSFAANYRLGGLVPWGYHAANVAIHILAALVLFDLVRRTLAAHFPGSASGLTAFAASALWALHPLQTESVTYIVQRAESLMGLFYLLALYGLARSLASGRPRAWLALSALCSAAGMGVKEAMVTAPVMVLLYDRTFGAGSFAECWKRRRGYYLALASGWVLLAALVVGNSGRGGTAGFGSGVAWWAYGLSQLRAVGIYLRLAVWPGPLVADYGRILGGPTLEVAGGAAAVLVLAGATGYLLYRSPPLGFLGAWFFVVLAPSSTFVPVATEIIAEHRMYLPLAAIAVGAACLASAALGRAGLAACLAAAVSLGAATAERNRVYLSNRAFWSDVAAKAPENAGGHNNLGNVLFEEGRYPEAIAEYGRALDLAPDYADAHTNLGNALARLGRYAEAVGHYETALKFRTADPSVLTPLANACYRLGNAAAEGGRPAEALAYYSRSIEIVPDNADALVNLGNVLAQLGRVPEAAERFRQALRLQPGSADIHNNLGSLLAADGKLAEARTEFEEALRLKPGYREALDNLARLDEMAPGGARR